MSTAPVAKRPLEVIQDSRRLPYVYVPHLSQEEALKLDVGDCIYCRDQQGKFYIAKIIEKNLKIVKVHFDEEKYKDPKWDLQIDLTKEFWRFQTIYQMNESSFYFFLPCLNWS